MGKPMDFLDQIAQKLHKRELILFVGSGMSAGCYPTWRDLLKELIAAHLHGDDKTEAEEMLAANQYLNAAGVIQLKIGNDLQKRLAQRFEKKPCPDVEARYKLLDNLPFRAIFTTNYDHFLNTVADRAWVTQAEELGDVLDKGRILKLHGDATRPDTMVLTAFDYADAKFNPKLTQLMETAAATSSFLFVGYSMEDEDVLLWLERTAFLGGNNLDGRHFALVDGGKWKANKRALYRKRFGVNIVDAPLADGYPDIAGFLEKLRAAWQELVSAELDWERELYIDPDIKPASAKDAPARSLDAFIKAWIADESKHLLVLLGEFGTGKTWFSNRVYDLTRAHGKRAPKIVRLEEFRQGATAKTIMKRLAGGAALFEESNEKGDFVLILDAFDEMGRAPGDKLNQAFEKLRHLVVGRAKVIITSRKEFFRDEEAERRVFGREAEASDDKVSAKGVEKVEIQLFNAGKIQAALAVRKKPEIFERIRGHKHLKDLASRPVLLNLITEYRGEFNSATRQVDLYEPYIQEMLFRGNRAMYAERRKFAEKLAWEIQQSGAGSIHVDEADQLGRELFQDDFDKNDDLLRSRTLLVRYELSNLTFGHTSFREYLVAKQIAPYLQRDEFRVCKLSDPTIRFIRELWEWKAPCAEEKDGMVFVPSGPFVCGEGDTARVENLTEGVWMDKYPVTNSQYLDFLKTQKKVNPDWIKHEYSRIKKGPKLEDAKYREHPVTGVTWHGAQEYAKFQGKRLPNDLEWEKAARGADGREYPWGDGFDKSKCNTADSGRDDTSAVTEYREGVSPYGCCDMAGNVWEWMENDYEPGEPYKSLRGGSWSDDPQVARCAVRYFDGSGYIIDYAGFRCARTSH
jgi:serine/threonine-protein kinase